MAYFTFTNLSANTKALAGALNTIFSAVVSGFDKLPEEANVREGNWTFADDTGAANAYIVTRTYLATDLADGMRVTMKVKASGTNTGASTINVDGLGTRSIKLLDGNDPAAGDIVAETFVDLVYNEDISAFVIMSPVGSQF